MTYLDARKYLFDAARDFTNRWEHSPFKEPHRLQEWDEAELLEKAALTYAKAREQALGEEEDVD
jgi:hypothetical protein